MRSSFTFVATLLAGGLIAGVGLYQSRAIADDAKAAGATGQCNFVTKNTFAGPFKTCAAPVTAVQCAESGKADENSGAVWTEGSCPTASAVGSCKRDNDTITYYDGDASALEIGCGFQSGTWTAAAK